MEDHGQFPASSVAAASATGSSTPPDTVNVMDAYESWPTSQGQNLSPTPPPRHSSATDTDHKPTVSELNARLARLAVLADELNVSHGDVMNAVSSTHWTEDNQPTPRPPPVKQDNKEDDNNPYPDDPYPKFQDDRPLAEMFESFARKLNRQTEQAASEPPAPKPSLKALTNKLIHVKRAVHKPPVLPEPVETDAKPSLKDLTTKLINIERAVRPALNRIQIARQTLCRQNLTLKRRDSTTTLDEYHNPIYWGGLQSPLGEIDDDDLLEQYLRENREEEPVEEDLQQRVEQLEALLTQQVEQPQPFVAEPEPKPEEPQEEDEKPEEDDADRIIVVPMGDHWVTKEVYYAEMEKRRREAEEALREKEKIPEDMKLPFGAKFADTTPASKDMPQRVQTFPQQQQQQRQQQQQIPARSPTAPMTTSHSQRPTTGFTSNDAIRPTTPQQSNTSNPTRLTTSQTSPNSNSTRPPTTSQSSTPIRPTPAKTTNTKHPPAQTHTTTHQPQPHQPQQQKPTIDTILDTPSHHHRPGRTDSSSTLPHTTQDTAQKAQKHRDDLKSYLQTHKPSDPTSAVEASDKENNFARYFRWFNLARAIATGVYGIVEASRQLKDPVYGDVGARGLLIVTIFFILVEILVAFIKAFPQVLWIFWNTEGWDPYQKYWTVWAIIADHELITDVVPTLVNVILKIYTYRLTEILAEPDAGNTLTQSDFTFTLSNIRSSKYHNFVLLLLFTATLTYTIIFHSIRLLRALSKKGATLLGVIVVIKGLCLLLDLFTNGAMLYEVLVYRGKDFLRLNQWTAGMMLSVVVVGPVVTLVVNALVNLPLHYLFLSLQLHLISSPPQPLTRILPTALRKTFHPYTLPIFLVALYLLIAILLVLGQLRSFSPLDAIAQGHIPSQMVPNSGFFGWGSGGSGDRRDVMFGLVWLDLVVNYGVGVAVTGVYWVWRGVRGVWGFLPCSS
ncbi:hypothetical protein HDV00_002830 [Rhizophlyctis rosea]|nr:hypothetical protein HDV00_002830 [Rhizophlyctis rosea]